MMFRYRKLYADLVSEDGEVCVVYATQLSLLGVELQSAGLERYTAQGERRVQRALGAARVDKLPGNVRIEFELPDGPLSLQLRGPSKLGSDPHFLTPALSWQVVAGSAESRLQSGAGLLEGTGYADYVEMTRPPRALGLCSVEWGRGHAGGDSFVFTRATFRSGAVFETTLAAGQRCRSCGLERRQELGVDLRLPGGSVSLHNERVLHRGSALDPARFPGVGERLVARLCSGRVDETRWLARAAFPSGSRGWALHERVTLGA